jgi:hypothetical protein
MDSALLCVSKDSHDTPHACMRALAGRGTGNKDMEHKRTDATQDNGLSFRVQGLRFRVEGLGIRSQKGQGTQTWRTQERR